MKNHYIDVDILIEIKNNFITFRYYMIRNGRSREDVINDLTKLKEYCENMNILISYSIEGAHITISYMNLKKINNVNNTASK